MNGDVICLITLNDVLRFVFRCMTLVTFENDFRSDLLLHDARDASCFRIPFHMIATLERLGHFGWFLCVYFILLSVYFRLLQQVSSCLQACSVPICPPEQQTLRRSGLIIRCAE